MLVKDGEVVAESPVVAGVYGTFTVRKPGKFSFSYNVREREQGLLQSTIMANLERNLSTNRWNQAILMQELAYNAETYDEVVFKLSTEPLTSVGHFVVAGVQKNEGVAITRDIDSVSRYESLSEEKSFLVMTN